MDTIFCQSLCIRLSNKSKSNVIIIPWRCCHTRQKEAFHLCADSMQDRWPGSSGRKAYVQAWSTREQVELWHHWISSHRLQHRFFVPPFRRNFRFHWPRCLPSRHQGNVRPVQRRWVLPAHWSGPKRGHHAR